MNSKVLGRVIEIELYSAIEGDQFRGHPRCICAFPHVEVMKDNILEGELRMGRSTYEPEKEDENNKKDNAGKEDKEYGVDLWGL